MFDLNKVLLTESKFKNIYMKALKIILPTFLSICFMIACNNNNDSSDGSSPGGRPGKRKKGFAAAAAPVSAQSPRMAAESLSVYTLK